MSVQSTSSSKSHGFDYAKETQKYMEMYKQQLARRKQETEQVTGGINKVVSEVTAFGDPNRTGFFEGIVDLGKDIDEKRLETLKEKDPEKYDEIMAKRTQRQETREARRNENEAERTDRKAARVAAREERQASRTAAVTAEASVAADAKASNAKAAAPVAAPAASAPSNGSGGAATAVGATGSAASITSTAGSAAGGAAGNTVGAVGGAVAGVASAAGGVVKLADGDSSNDVSGGIETAMGVVNTTLSVVSALV